MTSIPASAHSEPTSAPTHAPPRRILALDVLRGLAILGTLLTNIWMFSTVAPLKPGQLGAENAGTFEGLVKSGLELVTDGKWIGLLTIMFGIGLEIQRQSAVRKGDAWPGPYPWRALLLIVEGTLNYLFVFEFDVLMGYGLTALTVCFVMARSPRVQKIWMWIFLAAHVIHLLMMTTEGMGADPDGIEADLGTPEEESDLPVGVDEVRQFTYWGQVASRASGFIEGRWEIPIMFVMGLGLFMVGAHLFRAGIFAPEGAKLRRLTLGLAFGIGLPIDIACRTLWGATFNGGVARYGTSTLVAFGVLALVAMWYAHGRQLGPIGTMLTWVGRMALTCYILQNVLCSIIFYPWGFNVADKIPSEWNTWMTLLIYVGVAALLVFGSGLWLRFFSRGPFELVMHYAYELIVKYVHEPLAAKFGKKKALVGSEAP